MGCKYFLAFWVVFFILEDNTEDDSPPALVDLGGISAADKVFDVLPGGAVNLTPVGPADVQEVWPEAADGVLGNVGERLAHGGAKQEGADGLVNTGHIAAEGGFGSDAL